jgi:hypothetical protein
MSDLTESKIYSQLCADIKATDDISFKLMGAVPLVSGTGLIAILLNKDGVDPSILVTLSLFAAAITLGLFRWELRNIQTCRWLIQYADNLEKEALVNSKAYIQQPKSPQGIGKREAEKFIYGITIATWLVFPVLKLSAEQLQSLCKIYLPVAAIIATAAIISMFASIELVKKNDPHK